MKKARGTQFAETWHAMQRECAKNNLECVEFKDWDGKDAVMFRYGGEKLARLAVDHDAVKGILETHFPSYRMKRDSWTKVIIDIGSEANE